MHPSLHQFKNIEGTLRKMKKKKLEGVHVCLGLSL